jgi:periplasmic protein TonB
VPGAVNIVGAAVGLHALGFALLGLLEPPGRGATLEITVVAAPPEDVVVSAAPRPVGAEPPRALPARAAPAPAPPPSRPKARRRAAGPRATASATTTPAARDAAERTTPPSPRLPAQADAASDEAVLLAVIGQASRNGAAIDGGPGNPDGAGAAARASDFVRGATRGATAPPHESRAAPAEPVSDYTRLVPPYTSEAILHDVSASVALRVELDELGRVVHASVLKGAGYGLDEQALRTIRAYRFRPARDEHGRPVRAVFGWRIVWPSYWRRLLLESVYGRPNCRGHAPLNLGSLHPVYIDCDGPPGMFELEEAQ